MDYVVIILQKYAYFSVNCIELDYKCNILKLFTWALNYILVDCTLSSSVLLFYDYVVIANQL